MRHLDLFSGIGGFALAASWVWGDEYENVGHCEIEEYACKVYHKHFPNSPHLGDITKVKWHEGQADIITGGFPCQPHSMAGKRKASEDERDLWSECKRAVSEIRPRYALFENVAGLLTSERGRFFNRVLSDLAEIGYDVEWHNIPASALGAPHKRERIWIIAKNSEHAGAHRKKVKVGEWNLGDAIARNVERFHYASHAGREYGERQAVQGESATQTGARYAVESERPVERDRLRIDTDTATLGHRERKPEDNGPGKDGAADRPAEIHSESPNANGIGRVHRELEINTAVPRVDALGDTAAGDTAIADTNSTGLQGSPAGGKIRGRTASAGHRGSGGGNETGWDRNWMEVAAEFCGVFNGLLYELDQGGGLNESIGITGQSMPYLWHYIQQEKIWENIGGQRKLFAKEHMFAVLWKYFEASERQDNLLFESAEVQEAYVRNVWIGEKTGCAPCRWEYQEQRAGEYSDSLPQLSHEIALETEKYGNRQTKNRVERLKGLGNAIVPQVAEVILRAIKEQDENN